eukprot:m51a1_g8806 putative ras-related protein rab-36 (258) ;mRNA; f:280032-281123
MAEAVKTVSESSFAPATIEWCRAHPNEYFASKVVLVGEHGCGKTSLVARYCHNVSHLRPLQATIGVDFTAQKFRILDCDYALNIWDTAGEEKFTCITKSFYRGASVAIVAYDVNSDTSLATAPRWAEGVRDGVGSACRLVLAGLKADLYHAVTRADADRAARELCAAQHSECSSKDNQGVAELFEAVACAAFEDAVAARVAAEGGGAARGGAGASGGAAGASGAGAAGASAGAAGTVSLAARQQGDQRQRGRKPACC